MVTHTVPEHVPLAIKKNTIFAEKVSRLESFNRILIMTNIGQFIVLCLVLIWSHQIQTAAMSRPPWLLGMRPDGSLEALDPGSLALRPTEAFLRGELLRFAKLHFSRIPDSVSDDYAASLHFMDRRLTGQRIDADLNEIAQLKRGMGQVVRVKPGNVSILRAKGNCEAGKAVCQARIDYSVDLLNPTDHSLQAQKNYISEVNFVLIEVTNAMVKTNPLGIVITDLHTSEGFTQ